jgi:hypothetical protein
MHDAVALHRGELRADRIGCEVQFGSDVVDGEPAGLKKGDNTSATGIEKSRSELPMNC